MRRPADGEAYRHIIVRSAFFDTFFGSHSWKNFVSWSRNLLVWWWDYVLKRNFYISALKDEKANRKGERYTLNTHNLLSIFIFKLGDLILFFFFVSVSHRWSTTPLDCDLIPTTLVGLSGKRIKKVNWNFFIPISTADCCLLKTRVTFVVIL